MFIFIIKFQHITASPFSISALNESALLVSFGNSIDEGINGEVLSLHRAISEQPFAGFIESVPAYSSLAVFYDPLMVKKNAAPGSTAFGIVQSIVQGLISTMTPYAVTEFAREIVVPVCYEGEDLAYVASYHRLSVDEVIAIHAATTYRVFMIGFLPGFPYMGIVDPRIATPRRPSPRNKVLPGSVGIAGQQTGIYPLPSPGGWQLIGRTPLRIFDPGKEDPCLFKAGDIVRFSAISKKEFEELNEY